MVEENSQLSGAPHNGEDTEVFAQEAHAHGPGHETSTRPLRTSSPQEHLAQGEAAFARSTPSRTPRSTSGNVGKPVSSRYRPRLVRRMSAALGCGIFSAITAFLAVFTVKGQAIDTLSMEASMRWAEPLGSVGRTVTHIISVPAMVMMGALIVVIAWLRRRPTLAGRALGVVIAANTTTQVAKLLIERPDFHMSAATVNSLPSGHTTVATSLALALVMIAPEWFRGPAAWIGYVWTSLVGISVMVFGWHRPSDVLVAMAVSGFWALVLCPLETRSRHGVPVQKAMVVIAIIAGIVATLGLVYSLWALTPDDLAQMGSGGITYAEFLDALPRRAHILAGIASFAVVAVGGLVIHEVDRLSGK